MAKWDTRASAARQMLSLIKGRGGGMPVGEEEAGLPPEEFAPEAPPAMPPEAAFPPVGGEESIESLLVQIESSLEGIEPKKAQSVREHLNAIREILSDSESVPTNTETEATTEEKSDEFPA